ncbi:MAG: lipoate--protein ligase [Bacteroidales bacterium]|nr:lipoate--protein ligase [Bacteroidales bacterium]
MLIIDLNSNDPWFNLAAEEYFFRNTEEDIFLVYVNSTSLITGKHQNPAEEVNPRCLLENDIPLIRRISGGGTVYHDEGNLNYTYIKSIPDGKQVNFSEYTGEIITFLKKHGLDARRGDKNEIRADKLKISGNAEHVFKNRVLHHGTLLFSADLELMSGCLKKGTALIRSRAVKSNPSETGNLKGLLRGIKDVQELKTGLLDHIAGSNTTAVGHTLTVSETGSINKLKEEKYQSWEWNYAYGPDYTFSNNFDIMGEQASVRMEISGGVIRSCEFSGPAPLSAVESLLPGTRHYYDDIARILKENALSADDDVIFNFLM